mgnify:CR=1 FL=1
MITTLPIPSHRNPRAAVHSVERMQVQAVPVFSHKITPMGTISLLGTLLLISAATIATADPEQAEWRAFAGLLVGSVFSAAFGMAALALKDEKTSNWKKYALRFIVNLVSGVPGGALAVVVATHLFGLPVGPLLCSGCAFFMGISGITIWRTAVEPRLIHIINPQSDDEFVPPHTQARILVTSRKDTPK